MVDIDAENCDYVTCPFCGYKFDFEEQAEYDAGEHDEVMCPECEKEFMLYVEVTYSYSSYPYDQCKKCGANIVDMPSRSLLCKDCSEKGGFNEN